MVNGDKGGEVKLDKEPVREGEGEDLPEEERSGEKREEKVIRAGAGFRFFVI